MKLKKLWLILLAIWLILNGLGINVNFPILDSLNNTLALAAGILIFLDIK